VIWAVLALLALVVILALLLWVVWRSKPVVTGAPTGEDAKIDAEAQAKSKEVERADRRTLFGIARQRLRK